MTFVAVSVAAIATFSWHQVDASVDRNQLMREAYQRLQRADEAATARALVDVIAEREMRSKLAINGRVERLKANFAIHNARKQHVQELLGKAANAGAIPSTLAEETVTGSITPALTASNGLRLTTIAPSKALRGAMVAAPGIDVLKKIAEDPTRYAETEESLSANKEQQIKALKIARKKAAEKISRLAKLLKKRGIAVPKQDASAIGGPLIELKSGSTFLDTLNSLDDALAGLSRMRDLADTLPNGSPVPGKKISSRYGTRYDPFTGRRAVHGGLDFRAKRGTPILATASGTIVKAGRLGGYGKLVEIDHGNGLTTRYAHMSRILVKKGDKIRKGHRIGKVGSTGRSTGPHLHYEVRRKGRTRDPLSYVRLAKTLKPLL